MELYEEAHLIVAAIRILNHKSGSAPSIDEVCKLIDMSTESGHSVCRKLQERSIIEIMEDPFSVKLALSDYLAIEEIERGESAKNTLADELEKFKAGKKSQEQEIADLQAEIDRKKADKLTDIEAKFKKEMEKFQKGN